MGKKSKKARPLEMSSKINVHARNPFFQQGNTKQFRDPRFDPMCGSFNKEKFHKRYGFVDEIKKKEREQLKEELDNTEDEARKEQIILLLQRMNNQFREKEKREFVEKKTTEEKLENKQKVKEGNKPIFKKKSEKRLETLVAQYEHLKKTRKLQKHIEKRSKKLTTRERIQQEG